MQDKTKKICVLGGLYFVISFIINQLQSVFYTLSADENIVVCLRNISFLLGIVFIILFFIILFGKQIYFLNKFVEIYPKVSIYLYYIGYVGYVLLVFDILILVPTEFVSLNEITQKYLAWLIAGINIGGVITALFLATNTAFLRKKKM